MRTKTAPAHDGGHVSMPDEWSCEVPCGGSAHEVELRVSPWGGLETVFNPCSALPPSARRLADAETIRLLTESLKYGDRRVTRGAVEGLVAIGRPAVPWLAKAMKWRFAEARLAAARALRRIGDPATVPVFRSARKDEDLRVRQEAHAALSELGGAQTAAPRLT